MTKNSQNIPFLLGNL